MVEPATPEEVADLVRPYKRKWAFHKRPIRNYDPKVIDAAETLIEQKGLGEYLNQQGSAKPKLKIIKPPTKGMTFDFEATGPESVGHLGGCSAELPS